MLQEFHVDVAKVDWDIVAKVDRDVIYVLMVVHVCWKLLFPMFHLFFLDVCCKCVYLKVTYVLHRCYKCFIYMLRMFYNGLQLFFMWFL
jgi:hypothetical protein